MPAYVRKAIEQKNIRKAQAIRMIKEKQDLQKIANELGISFLTLTKYIAEECVFVFNKEWEEKKQEFFNLLGEVRSFRKMAKILNVEEEDVYNYYKEMVFECFEKGNNIDEECSFGCIIFMIFIIFLFIIIILSL